ncbi:MAG: SIMPL domain-containing protein [Pseudogulbenkiania sp.]|nr:SIMPL domain-containing protein [Pseudogulbenkiania sp.]
MTRLTTLLSLAAPLFLLAPLAPAAEPTDPAATVLHLSASAQREIANDQLVATLYVQDRQPQPAQLANRLNQLINRAQNDARGYKNVEVSSGSYNSWPAYNKSGKIDGWQGRAELKLKSRDMAQGSELIAKLQSYMLLEGVQFVVSDDARRAAEKAMIPEAIAALMEQAQIAAKTLGKRTLNMQQLTIGNQSPPPVPLLMRTKTLALAADAEVAPAE